MAAKRREAVESLRALAAWLDQDAEPDPEDRAAVRARWENIDKSAEMLGELAGWDEAVLREAVGPVLDDDEESWPGRSFLLSAALRAEQQAEPPPVSAERAAFSALLGAMAVVDQETRADWVKALAGHRSTDPVASLALAWEVAPTQAWASRRDAQVELARELLAEAEAACRRARL